MIDAALDANLTLRLAVVATARSWIDTPWRHQARLKGIGVDCLGLVGCVGVERGFASALEWLRDESMHTYGLQPNEDLLLGGLRKYLVPANPLAPRIADILVLQWAREHGREPPHFAIVTSVQPLMIVHAYRSAHQVGECSIDAEWRIGISWRSLVRDCFSYREVVD